MLNRAKKNLIIAALAGTLCLALPCFAYDSTISFVNINNLAYYDVEIVITDNNEILVPFKQLAELFDIKFEANRVDKKISFKTWDGKDGMVTQQGVFVEDYPVTKRAPIFILQGLVDGVFNDAYIPASAAEQVMGIKLNTDYETLSLEATVERDIPLLANAKGVEENKGPRAYKDVVAPKKQGKITLNTIGLRSNLNNDAVSTEYKNYNRTYKSINDTFNGTTQASINGNILGGKYRVEATEYHYRSRAFMFGGVTGTYRNSFTGRDYKNLVNKQNDKIKYYYELGKVRGSSDIDAQIGTNIFGAQIWDWDNEKIRPQDITGYVKPTSLVRLTVNDLEPVVLSTYSGYYTLKDVQLPNPVLRVKLEELNEDGTEELIMDEKYSPFDRETPLAKEKRATAYAGVWGYQDRLFRDGENIYRGNNKKVTAGGEYIYGLKDNITFKSKLTGDKLYEKNGTSIFQVLPTNDSILVTGTQKSVNYLEGATTLNSIEWKSEKNKAIKARATAGASVAHDIREHSTHIGYTGKLTGEYDKDLSQYSNKILKPKRLNGKLELFQNSPDWYIASSDSTSKNDRTGGRASGGLSFNNTSASGSYMRYLSNMNHRYRGGTLTFDEVNINGSTKVPYVADVRFNSYYRHGKNDLGRNFNYNYDFNIYRNFNNYAQLQLGRRENRYDTRYNVETSYDRNYNTKYTDNYAQIEVPIGQKFGRFLMGHNIIRYNSAGYKNGYNMFKFGYTFPTWKRLTLSAGWGFHYYGQKGHDVYTNLSYRAKSGQSISVGYNYSQNGGYFIDNMFMPTTNRHSINFTFNDAFQVFNHGLKSVGEEDMRRGLFEAIAFVDVNGDGKYTKGVDVPMSGVPLITSWTGETNITNKRGRVYSSSLDEGIYTVTINMDELPIVVAPQTNDQIIRRVKIDGGRTTRLEIPLVSTVGSVSGVLKISDDFDRNLRISDFVVVLLDKDGNEVNYSTVDSTGEFYISGLAPGKYKLQLDENFINEYGLEELPNSSIDIIIPYDYKNPTDLTDQNLEYRAMAL